MDSSKQEFRHVVQFVLHFVIILRHKKASALRKGSFSKLLF